MCVSVCSFQQYCKAAMTHFSPQWDCSFFFYLPTCISATLSLLLRTAAWQIGGVGCHFYWPKANIYFAGHLKEPPSTPSLQVPSTQPSPAQPVDLLRERPKRSLLDPFNGKSVASLHVQHGIKLHKKSSSCKGTISDHMVQLNMGWLCLETISSRNF